MIDLPSFLRAPVRPRRPSSPSPSAPDPAGLRSCTGSWPRAGRVTFIGKTEPWSKRSSKSRGAGCAHGWLDAGRAPDQETAQTDDPLQVVPALPVVPSSGPAPRGGGKPRCATRAPSPRDIGSRRRSSRVFTRNQRDRSVNTIPDHDDPECARRNLCSDTNRRGRRSIVGDFGAGRTISGRPQRLHAAGKLQTAARVDKGKLLADDPEPTGCRTAHRTAATRSAQLLPRPAMCG